jgi:hypothetical protein
MVNVNDEKTLLAIWDKGTTEMELFTTSDLPSTKLSPPYLSLLDGTAGVSAGTDGHNNLLRLFKHAVSWTLEFCL